MPPLLNLPDKQCKAESNAVGRCKLTRRFTAFGFDDHFGPTRVIQTVVIQ